MVDQTVIDMEVELNLLRSRIDAIRGEVTTFLSEVGAPNLVEARDRFRRFAGAAVELPSKIEKLQAMLALAQKGKDESERVMLEQRNNAKELRTKLQSQKEKVSTANARMNISRAAIQEAVDLLESPMFAGFSDETGPVISSLSSALRDIPADLPTDEVKSNAKV